MVRYLPTEIDKVLNGPLAGIYTCLFFEAGYIMLRKRKENITSGRVSTFYSIYVCQLTTTSRQKVFLITTLVMYILSTAHIGT